MKTEAAWKARTGLSAISRRDFGYFPTILATSQGGYGASDSHTYVAVGAGERMRNQALIRVREILGELRKVPDPGHQSSLVHLLD